MREALKRIKGASRLNLASLEPLRPHSASLPRQALAYKRPHTPSHTHTYAYTRSNTHRCTPRMHAHTATSNCTTPPPPPMAHTRETVTCPHTDKHTHLMAISEFSLSHQSHSPLPSWTTFSKIRSSMPSVITGTNCSSSSTTFLLSSSSGVGYFSNERGFSVESSLQRISSKFLFGNETIRRYYCKRDVGAANIRPAQAAENKRRALRNYFSERICFMFLISKCRGDWDLGHCTTSGHPWQERCKDQCAQYPKSNAQRSRLPGG